MPCVRAVLESEDVTEPRSVLAPVAYVAALPEAAATVAASVLTVVASD